MLHCLSLRLSYNFSNSLIEQTNRQLPIYHANQCFHKYRGKRRGKNQGNSLEVSTVAEDLHAWHENNSWRLENLTDGHYTFSSSCSVVYLWRFMLGSWVLVFSSNLVKLPSVLLHLLPKLVFPWYFPNLFQRGQCQMKQQPGDWLWSILCLFRLDPFF